MIQWFPGHMAKTIQSLRKQASSIDGLIDIRDARLPWSSKNPVLDELFKHKPRLIVLNKADLADPAITKLWIKKLTAEAPKDQQCRVIPFSSKQKSDIQVFLNEAKKISSKAHKKFKNVGFTPPLYLAVFGIPNVGKSTFINTMMGKRHAKIGDRPGVTKSLVWNKITDFLNFLDTPGLLWQKFESEEAALKLALVFAIKKERLNVKQLATYGAQYLIDNYPGRLKHRYDLDSTPDLDFLFEAIAGKRKFLLQGSELDLERAYDAFLKDLRSGAFGRVSFESPT